MDLQNCCYKAFDEDQENGDEFIRECLNKMMHYRSLLPNFLGFFSGFGIVASFGVYYLIKFIPNNILLRLLVMAILFFVVFFFVRCISRLLMRKMFFRQVEKLRKKNNEEKEFAEALTKYINQRTFPAEEVLLKRYVLSK